VRDKEKIKAAFKAVNLAAIAKPLFRMRIVPGRAQQDDGVLARGGRDGGREETIAGNIRMRPYLGQEQNWRRRDGLPSGRFGPTK
jgi:hypothetical protein